MREYFYCADEVEGDFSDRPAFRKKSNWNPDRNRKVAIEAYVEWLERKLLTHDFEVPYQRNFTKEGQRALENLRRYDDIIIKQADRGSAVVILDKQAYIREGMRQLDDPDVYVLLDHDPTEEMIMKVNLKVQECFNKGNIDEKTRDYLMASEDARAGRFYLIPKLHKQGCPGRPVVSRCSSPREKISEFVDHHLRPLVVEMSSHIKDTNDFLHKLDGIGHLPEGAILCTIDVVGLYPHIPHSEGLAVIRDALLASVDPEEEQWEGSLSEDVVSFAKLVLEGNNFEFDGKHFIQKLGTAIGTRMAPSYANIFMDKLER